MTRYRYLAASLLLLGLGACRQQPEPQPTPVTENADWYILRSPEAREIVAVTGDLDGTLIITTSFNIYRTTDRGKTWQTSRPSNLGIFGFVERRDTLFTFTARWGSLVDSTTIYAAHPTDYSADQGRTWQHYQFTSSTLAFASAKAPLNRVRTPSGTTYRLATEQLPTAPTSNSFYVISKGILGPAGPLLPLPQEHQANSLYLDKQARLYVAASAPVCGRGKNFGFCGEQNGVLYISKKPLP